MAFGLGDLTHFAQTALDKLDMLMTRLDRIIVLLEQQNETLAEEKLPSKSLRTPRSGR